MKRQIIPALIALLALCAITWPGSFARPPSAPIRWKLVWSDEFNTAKVDLSKWAIGDNAETNYDGGINTYDPANVYQANGNLVIRATEYLNHATRKPRYVAGRVTTKNKFSFLYGKVEVSAKLPGTQGLWPAIWMLRNDGTWPPEIDIMEMLGSDPKQVYMTLHYGTRKEEKSDQSHFVGPDFTADYHVFSVEWSPGLIRWVIDGVERKRTTEHVPDRPMYLRMNTSVGGEWPGNPNKATVLPQYFSVDYVRVYQAR